MPIYSGFPRYGDGKFYWPNREDPIAWVRIR
jgi:hypothetical protein